MRDTFRDCKCTFRIMGVIMGVIGHAGEQRNTERRIETENHHLDAMTLHKNKVGL